MSDSEKGSAYLTLLSYLKNEDLLPREGTKEDVIRERLEREEEFKTKKAINRAEEFLQILTEQSSISNIYFTGSATGYYHSYSPLTLKNKNISHSEFLLPPKCHVENVKFQDVYFRSVFFRCVFKNCEMIDCGFNENITLDECVFDNFKATRCMFPQSIIRDSTFKNTDFSDNYSILLDVGIEAPNMLMMYEKNNKFENCVIDYESVVKIAKEIGCIHGRRTLFLEGINQKTREFLVCANLIMNCEIDESGFRFKKTKSPINIKKDGQFINLDMFQDFSITSKRHERGYYYAGKEEIYQSLSSQHIYPNEILCDFNK